MLPRLNANSDQIDEQIIGMTDSDQQSDPCSSAELPGSLTIGQAQQMVDQWINDIGVRYFQELTNLGQLVEEVGELSRIMVRGFGEQSFKPGKAPENLKEALGDELADVLFVLICIANQTGVDLTDALRKNLRKKTQRDVHRHKNNEKLNK